MGIVGGLLGATFNCINKRLAKYRMRNVHPKPKLVRYLHPSLLPLGAEADLVGGAWKGGRQRGLSAAWRPWASRHARSARVPT